MLRFEFYKICKQKMIFLAFGILLLYAAAAVLEIYHPDHWNNIVSFEDGETVNGREGLAVNQSRAEQDAGELTDELAAAYPHIDFPLTYGYSDSWETFLYSYFKLVSVFSFFIVVVFSPLFSYETHCGMAAIVHTAPCGKIKCARVKILMSVMITNIAFVIVTLIMAAGFLIRYGMCGYDTSIQIGRFGYFYKSQIPMNYLELSIHYLLLSMLCVNMILLIVLIVSLKSRAMLQALIASLAALYIFDQTAVYAVIKSDRPFYFLSLFPVNALKITSVVSDFDPVTIFGRQLQWIYLVEIFYLFALGIGFWILCGKVVKSQKYYGE
ncbi:MAG: hypothetical protein NC409_14020 [Clostridium sp.]|nr:hypothetical protein [Clostridium sp.]